METVDKSDGIIMNDIATALTSLNGWGSVEIFVQDGKITQIASRKITKTKHDISDINHR